MKFIVSLIFSCLLISEITFSQANDSIVQTNKVKILNLLRSTNQYIYPIYSKVANGYLKIPYGSFLEREQVLMKVNNDIYVRYDGGGFLYKLIELNDSNAVFKKIDKTVNLNYCIGSFNFTSKSDIYNYGGYGFWKNNGLIRKFDEKSREWSVLKTNIEVAPQIFKINNVWHDYKNNLLFTAFQYDINAALKENAYQIGKILPIAYKFDLKSNDWSVLGNTTEIAVNLLKESNLFLSTERGLIVLSFEQLYLFDYLNNKILKLNDNVFAQLYMRITDHSMVFHTNKTLYSIERESEKIDSVHLDIDEFEFTGEHIYNPIKNYTWLWILGGVIFLVSTFISIKIIIDKRVQRIKAQSSDSKNFKFEFSDIEKALIRMLLEKSNSHKTATINEINYVLGVKDKNIGLQKKVRSEVFNAVNEKFKLISDWDEPLVQSIRSENDKRYFEYMIRKDMIKEAERVLED
ncbi:MAG: hypothetical protein ACO3AA_00210 [Chitinophagaceae bacterium]